MWSPNSLGSFTLSTLYNAFLITEYARPAAISGIVAPSFCACFTLEFINTVQRDPKSIGIGANKPSLANCSIGKRKDVAKVSIKEPQPEEQASFNTMSSMYPSRTFVHFIS